MGLFDFISGLFGPKSAVYYFSCPKCSTECCSTSERCEKCSFKIKDTMARKCPKCSSLNELSNGRCSKCMYNLAADKVIKFIYVCPLCAHEYEKYISSCRVCGSLID